MALVQETTLGTRASCLQFCSSTGFEHLLALGTYQLDESTQSRRGELQLYSATSPGTDSGLKLLCSSFTAGAFELTWCPHVPQFALALSSGQVELYSLGAAASEPVHSLKGSLACFQDAMCTSLSFSAGQTSDDLAVSSSKGYCCLLTRVRCRAFCKLLPPTSIASC